MAIPHAQPGQVIDVLPLGEALPDSKTGTLIKTKRFEVIRMVMPAGKELSQHQAPGEISVQCIEGHIAFTAMGKTEELHAGQMLFLPAAEPHSVRALQNSSFLLTIMIS
jgi:quercetin dioxygenase-like cupin family protein